MSEPLSSIGRAHAEGFILGGEADPLNAGTARVGDWLAIAWRKILLAIVLIEIPLQIDTYLRHDADASQFGAISGFNISLTTICLFFLYAQWIPKTLVLSERIRFSKPLLAYVAIAGLSIIWARDRSLAISDVFLLLQGFLVFLYIANTIKTRAEVWFVVRLLILGLLLQGFMMVVLRLVGDDIRIGPLEFQIFSRSNRLAGSLGSPNVAGSYLALLLPLSWGVLFARAPKSLHYLALAAMTLGSVGLVLTMSRGAWVAAAFSASIFFIAAMRRNWLSFRAVALLGFGGLILAGIFFQPITERIFGEDHGSAISRVPLFQLTAQMIAEHPMGVGANNWDAVARSLASSSEFRNEWYFIVHNKYLLIWAEVGILGLAAFVWFLLSTINNGLRIRNVSSGKLAPIAVGCTAGICGLALHMNVDVFNSRVQCQMLLLVCALVFAIVGLVEEVEPEPVEA